MATENGMVLSEKIDQYVELVSKLDKQIETLKNELKAHEVTLENISIQLTEKDILLDRKIRKLNQIRSLVDEI